MCIPLNALKMEDGLALCELIANIFNIKKKIWNILNIREGLCLVLLTYEWSPKGG